MAVQELKELGNKRFGEGEFAEAEHLYSQAIEEAAKEGTDAAVLFSNRANARLKISDFEGALMDATRATELEAGFAKAHHRRGLALLALHRPREAVEALAWALAVVHGSDDRLALSELLTRAEVECARGVVAAAADVEGSLALLERMHGMDLLLAMCREPLAALVVACETHVVDDARLAAVAQVVASRNAGVLAIFHGALEALVAIADRATRQQLIQTRTFCDAVRALASATAGRAEGKAALIKADIVGLVRRVLGNAESGAGLLQELLSATPETSLTLRDVVEAIAELASHSDDVRSELHAAGVVPILLGLLGSSASTVRAMSASALGGLCEHPTIRTELLAAGIVQKLLPLLEATDNMEEVLEAADAVRVIVEIADGAKSVVADTRVMDAIFNQATISDAAARLICDLASKPPECVPTNSLLSRIPLLLSASSAKSKSACMALTGFAVHRADTAETVLEKGKERFLEWVNQSDDRELRAAGITLLGNVVRSEQIVSELSGAAEMLVRLTVEECNRPDIAEDTRVLLASLAALRNFAVPRGNREALAEAGVIHASVLALQRATRKDMRVAFEACVLMLAIVRGSPRRASMFANEPNAMATVMKIAKGDPVCDGDQPVVVVDSQGHRDLRVQYEASRLAAELCCTLGTDVAAELHRLGVLASLQLLASSPFEILVTEATRAIQALKDAGI